MGWSKKYQTGNQQGKKKVRTHETQWRRGRHQRSSDDGPQFERPKNDDPTLKEAVDALKKGENVRIPGLLDERIEECGPNRNCYAAVKRERNASKPPLEEFLSRFLGQK